MDFTRFKEFYQNVPVEHYPHDVEGKPLVSVCVQTYQQAPYIIKCLDGILKQKTDFQYEILLGEDDSSDTTRELCLDYARKYPDIVRLFLHRRENNIRIQGQPTGRFNFLYNLFNSEGRYVALCEGDDYWSDANKLQLQVDFMESHNGYSGCFTDYSMVNLSGDIILEKVRGKQQEDYYDRLTILEKGLPQTCTVLYKNIPQVFRKLASVKNALNGDRVLAVFMAQQGKIKFLNEVTASRRVGSGMFSILQREKQLNSSIETTLVLKRRLNEPDQQLHLNRRLNDLYLSQILNALKNGDFREAMRYNGIRKKETGMPIDNKLQRLLDYIWGGAKFRIQRIVSKWKQG